MKRTKLGYNMIFVPRRSAKEREGAPPCAPFTDQGEIEKCNLIEVTIPRCLDLR